MKLISIIHTKSQYVPGYITIAYGWNLPDYKFKLLLRICLSGHYTKLVDGKERFGRDWLTAMIVKTPDQLFKHIGISHFNTL